MSEQRRIVKFWFDYPNDVPGARIVSSFMRFQDDKGDLWAVRKPEGVNTKEGMPDEFDFSGKLVRQWSELNTSARKVRGYHFGEGSVVRSNSTGEFSVVKDISTSFRSPLGRSEPFGPDDGYDPSGGCFEG